jgi:tetratricopeptide (TPR) repeat protein
MPAREPGSRGAAPEGGRPAPDGPSEYRWPDEGEGDRVDAPAYELFVRGTSFLAGGHPGPAATLLRRAASLAPTKNSIREALARSYYALGQFEAAAAEFERIAEAVPSNDYAQFGLGCSLLALERPIEARGRLRLAAAMNPDRREYGERLEQAEQAAVEARLDEVDADDA